MKLLTALYFNTLAIVWFGMAVIEVNGRGGRCLSLRTHRRYHDMMRCSNLLLFLLVPVLVVCGCEKESSHKKSPGETRAAALNPLHPKSEGFNLKETKLAAIPKDSEKWSVIAFSADGSQVLYQTKINEGEVLVTSSSNGETAGPVYEKISWLQMSPDGRSFAFGGDKDGNRHLVVDNKELRDLSDEEVAPSAFSADGRYVACEVGSMKKKKWFIALSDGEKVIYRSQVFPQTYRRPIFSPDGRILVYELGDDPHATGPKKNVFFLDVSSGKIVKEQNVAEYEIRKFSFNADSSRVIYDMQQDGNQFLVLHDFRLNLERRAVPPADWSGEFVLTPDGKHIVYSMSREGKQYLLTAPWSTPEKGKKSRPYDRIKSPGFGPDRTTVAYFAVKRSKWLSVVGDREGSAKYDGVGDAPAVFGPDGRTIAYTARKGGVQDRDRVFGGKWFMVLSHAGHPAVVKEGPAYDMVVTQVFSPDGKRIAYRARKGPMEKAKRFIVIADVASGKVIKEAPVGDEIWPPVWSADSKTVGYGARNGRELWWRVERLK